MVIGPMNMHDMGISCWACSAWWAKTMMSDDRICSEITWGGEFVENH